MIYPEAILCNFDTVRFFIVSGNIFDPIVYYSHVMAAIPALILGSKGSGTFDFLN